MVIPISVSINADYFYPFVSKFVYGFAYNFWSIIYNHASENLGRIIVI